MAEATDAVLEYLRGHVEPGKAPLGGNSVGTDKRVPRSRHARRGRATCTTG